MNNVKKNRTRLKFLNGKISRFTMNKTQQNQPVYSKVQPRFPGTKGNRAGQNCQGSDTNVGCKTCYGCKITFDVSSNAFAGAYPSFGSFANINPITDLSANPPCEWKYNAIVEGFSLIIPSEGDKNARVTISIEDDKCVQDICGVYFYAPVGGSTGTYTGFFNKCGDHIQSDFPISPPISSTFVKTAKRMGAPYRNPIAGWRNSLNCNYKDCSGTTSSGASRHPAQPKQTIYKDNYSGLKGSGLDGCGACPKDCSNTKIVHRSGIQGRTHRPIIRSGMQPKSSCCKPNGTQCFNNYSYSYRQYQNNKRCMSYERSLEKYILPGSAGCLHKKSKNVYRKSSCCDCDCDGDMQYGPKCSNKAETHTVYKPSNKKFSNQGAVSSGSRLDRLKLDAIRASNSKCIKDKRCNTIKSKSTGGCDYKVPNGKYGAGKPRFTGWMFNGHHSEVKGRVYNMVRYNQQPLGIPQLTAHPPGKTCIKQCFPRTLNLGSNRSTAAGNRARIPGSKCVTKSPCDCLPAEDNNFTVGNAGTFWGFDGGTGNLVPPIIDGSSVEWIGWNTTIGSFQNQFYIQFEFADPTMPQDHFDSISFINCNNPSIRTYYTTDATYNPTYVPSGGRPTWRWDAAASGYSIASESAYWQAAVGQTLKMYIDNVPQLCPECNCAGCNNNLNYTNQGVPCC
jgi:hypothetical protein